MNKDTNFFLTGEVSDSWKPTIKLIDKVRFLLLAKGMSQNDLADEVGINKGTLSKILHGDWIPSSQVKVKLSRALDVDSLVIFGDEEYFTDYQKSIKQNKDREEAEDGDD